MRGRRQFANVKEEDVAGECARSERVTVGAEVDARERRAGGNGARRPVGEWRTEKSVGLAGEHVMQPESE